MGDSTGTTIWGEPVMLRPQFGPFGKAMHPLSMSFVAQAAIDNDVAGRLGLAKRVVPVRNTRRLRKSDMLHNTACPEIRVDTQTFQVFADVEPATCEPAQRLCLTQRYMLR